MSTSRSTEPTVDEFFSHTDSFSEATDSVGGQYSAESVSPPSTESNFAEIHLGETFAAKPEESAENAVPVSPVKWLSSKVRSFINNNSPKADDSSTDFTFKFEMPPEEDTVASQSNADVGVVSHSNNHASLALAYSNHDLVPADADKTFELQTAANVVAAPKPVVKSTISPPIPLSPYALSLKNLQDECLELLKDESNDILKDELMQLYIQLQNKLRNACPIHVADDIKALANAATLLSKTLRTVEDQLTGRDAVKEFEHTVKQLRSFRNPFYQDVAKLIGRVILAATCSVVGILLGAAIFSLVPPAMLYGAYKGSLTGYAFGIAAADKLNLNGGIACGALSSNSFFGSVASRIINAAEKHANRSTLPEELSLSSSLLQEAGDAEDVQQFSPTMAFK